ncbi:MAG TPA: alanine racemase [Propionibacteriaceae bacterium]|nr:alanine racemase [Propionibacteriaceae bacterium]
MLYATHARVHLDHIVANLRAVRERVGERAVLLAIKGNAYGHGAVPVARAVLAAGAADWLGVATVPEGVELREAGITAPILKLSHALDDEVEEAVRAGLVLTVVSADTVVAAERAAASLGLTCEVHLKVDTGMRRIGVEPMAAPAVARLADHQPHLALTGIFTHLPASDDPTQDEFTRGQLQTFTEVVDRVSTAIGRTLPYVHAANSGAVLAHPDAWGTMVRPGIIAYGSYPDPSTPRTVDLLPGLTLASRVSFVKRIRAGETVSYGRTWTAPSDTTIATVPIGYADGFSRLNSNRGHVLVNGRRYPIAGRVCMDQTMVDVGDDDVAVGDEVVAIGPQGDNEITATEVASVMGTIPYEVTCLLTRRVTRLYG